MKQLDDHLTTVRQDHKTYAAASVICRGQYDLESPILEVANYKWCYALLMVQARNDDADADVETDNSP